MIHSITLEGFKCFRKRNQIPLSQINVMYGKNGRGKSTVAQSLLLLAQTMRDSNDINGLHLIGDLIELGTFDEIVNIGIDEKAFFLDLQDDTETVELGFIEYPHKTQMARLSKLIVNDENRFDVRANEAKESGKQEISTSQSVSTTSDIMILQNLKSLQYVSADRLGPRNSSPRKDTLDSDWFGVNGEYVINVLSNQGEDFQAKVCEVLSKVLTGATLKVKTNDADRIELFLDSVNNGKSFRPMNVGFGYSYVLPVIVAALLAKEKSILIIENPEAHLHPGAQSRLTQFLIEIAKTNNIQLLIETHSDHVVNGLRIAMKQSFCNLTPQDAEIVFFSHDDIDTKPEVEIIKCDRFGELNKYPDDFLDEWTKQLVKLV